MEYAKGEELDQILKERKSIPLEKGTVHRPQIADALEEATAKGVVCTEISNRPIS